MLYKNAELHNVAEIISHEDGSISWLRIPAAVQEKLETAQGKKMACNATGVELRFVLKGEKAILRMQTTEADGFFHVYRGGIQGGWEDHTVHKQIRGETEDFVIQRAKNPEHLQIITEKSGYAWDAEVIRVIFDRGYIRIHDLIGDMAPPRPEQCPKKTLLAYGSSITHGSNALDASHAWASVAAHHLGMDVRNLGMAGSCAMEPEMVEYIAALGEEGKWDAATLELGVNVLKWPEEKIMERVENTLCRIAGRNPDKPVLVISPFYHCGDDFDAAGHGKKWRRCIEDAVQRLNYSNVTYVNGLDVIGEMSFMSADEVHPNIYGVQQIAQKLTEQLRKILK